MEEPQSAQSRSIAGRYELDVLIGKGGIAEVWRARHLALNSYVAIKFLQGASAQNEATRRRFTTEAQVTAQLKSQHAVQVFDFGVTEEGQPYLVMELLEGETLGRRLERQGRLGVVETARLLGQSARALHRAHQIGIVHRDFKPENVVICADDEGRDYVKVVDFGIAKLVGDLDPVSADWARDLAAAPPSTFTKTGALLGTPSYMAPEQVRNATDVDLRADVWAFAVVAFECLTGFAPFIGETLRDLFRQIESGRHPDPRSFEPTVPPGFKAWFETACAPEPAKRFPDVQAAWKALVVSLECGKVDLDPSVTRGAPPTEIRRAPLPRPNTADANAETMDAALPVRGVESRHHPRSAGVIRLAPSSAPPPPGPSEPEAMSHTIASRRRGAPRDGAKDLPANPAVPVANADRRALPIVALLLALAMASVLAWRVAIAPTRESPATAASPGPPVAVDAVALAPATTSERPAIEGPSALAPFAASPAPTASGTSAPAPPKGRTHARPPAVRASAAVPPAQPVAPPPASPAPASSAPPPAPSAIDPSSYR